MHETLHQRGADFLVDVRLRKATDALVALYDKEVDAVNATISDPDSHHSYCTEQCMVPIAKQFLKVMDILYEDFQP